MSTSSIASTSISIHPLQRPFMSLRRQLLLWLLLPQLVLWLVAGLLGYRIALNYAEKGIDQSLTQTVKSLARQIKPLGSGLLIDFPKAAQDIIEQDPEDRVSYIKCSWLIKIISPINSFKRFVLFKSEALNLS